LAILDRRIQSTVVATNEKRAATSLARDIDTSLIHDRHAITQNLCRPASADFSGGLNRPPDVSVALGSLQGDTATRGAICRRGTAGLDINLLRCAENDPPVVIHLHPVGIHAAALLDQGTEHADLARCNLADIDGLIVWCGNHDLNVGMRGIHQCHLPSGGQQYFALRRADDAAVFDVGTDQINIVRRVEHTGVL